MLWYRTVEGSARKCLAGKRVSGLCPQGRAASVQGCIHYFSFRRFNMFDFGAAGCKKASICLNSSLAGANGLLLIRLREKYSRSWSFSRCLVFQPSVFTVSICHVQAQGLCRCLLRKLSARRLKPWFCQRACIKKIGSSGFSVGSPCQELAG